MGHPARLRRVALLHLGRIHDETPQLRAYLAQHGIASELVPLPPWPEPDGAEAADRPGPGRPGQGRIDWCRFDRVSVRDCRDCHRPDDFLLRMRRLARHLESLGVPLVNPLPVIEAGHAKSGYLPQLERDGLTLIPSRWLPRGWCGSLVGLLERCGWREAVLKPAVGSRSWQTYRVRREGTRLRILAADGTTPLQSREAGAADAWLARQTRDGEVCLQRFLPAICGEGEFSAVFLDGRFSHAVAKTVAKGGWIAHEGFGGRNRLHSPSSDERHWAEAVAASLGRRFGVLPYARIDGIRDGSGALLLLECELVVPRLFLREGGAWGAYAEALLGADPTRMA